MIKHGFLFLLVSGLAISLFACAPGTVSEPEVTLNEKPEIQSARASWEVEWQSLIKAARKEGQVVIYAGAFPPEVSRWLIDAFQKQFGIEVALTSGPPLSQVEKVFRERKAGLFLSDIWIGGPTNNLIQLKPAGVLKPLEDVLFLPEVVDRTIWMTPGDGPFFDRDHYIAVGMNSVQPMLAGNAQLVRPGEVKSLRDLLDPKWKGKIAIGDPTQGGSKTAFMWVYRLMGERFVRELVQQQPVLIRDKRQLVEWIAKGKASLGLGVSQDQVAALRQAGAAVEYIPVEEGMLITFGATSASLFDRAPHPNSARLLLNWLFTKNSQIEWGQRHDMASRRLDVSNEWIEPLRRVQSGVKYHTTNEDFYLTQDKDVDIITEILKPLM